MFNMMPMLRSRNIFGGYGGGQNNPPPNDPYANIDFRPNPLTPPQPSSPIPNQMATGPLDTPPEGPATGAFRKFLEVQPSRDQYQPSTMQKIKSSLSGIAAGARGEDAVGASNKVLDEPYNQAMEDYKTKGNALSTAADLEQKTARTKFQDELEKKKLENETRNSFSLKENRESLDKSRTARNAINDYKAKNPNLVFKAVQGGNVMGFDPSGKNKPIDTGVSSGTLSDSDKLGMIQDNTLEAISARGDQSIRLEGAKQGNKMDVLQWKKDNKGKKLIFPKGGNIMGVDEDGNAEEITGADGKPIATGTLSDADKAAINGSSTTETNTDYKLDKDGNVIGSTRKTTKNSGNNGNSGGTPKPSVTKNPDGTYTGVDSKGKSWKIKEANVAQFKMTNGIK